MLSLSSGSLLSSTFCSSGSVSDVLVLFELEAFFSPDPVRKCAARTSNDCLFFSPRTPDARCVAHRSRLLCLLGSELSCSPSSKETMATAKPHGEDVAVTEGQLVIKPRSSASGHSSRYLARPIGDVQSGSQCVVVDIAVKRARSCGSRRSSPGKAGIYLAQRFAGADSKRIQRPPSSISKHQSAEAIN